MRQDIYEHYDDRPREWVHLQQPVPPSDNYRYIEWDAVTQEWRMTAPLAYNNPPHAPAP